MSRFLWTEFDLDLTVSGNMAADRVVTSFRRCLCTTQFGPVDTVDWVQSEPCLSRRDSRRELEYLALHM